MGISEFFSSFVPTVFADEEPVEEQPVEEQPAEEVVEEEEEEEEPEDPKEAIMEGIYIFTLSKRKKKQELLIRARG
jgi:ubiquinol-cytochrome c reductase subunit 6